MRTAKRDGRRWLWGALGAWVLLLVGSGAQEVRGQAENARKGDGIREPAVLVGSLRRVGKQSGPGLLGQINEGVRVAVMAGAGMEGLGERMKTPLLGGTYRIQHVKSEEGGGPGWGLEMVKAGKDAGVDLVMSVSQRAGVPRYCDVRIYETKLGLCVRATGFAMTGDVAGDARVLEELAVQSAILLRRPRDLVVVAPEALLDGAKEQGTTQAGRMIGGMIQSVAGVYQGALAMGPVEAGMMPGGVMPAGVRVIESRYATTADGTYRLMMSLTESGQKLGDYESAPVAAGGMREAVNKGISALFAKQNVELSIRLEVAEMAEGMALERCRDCWRLGLYEEALEQARVLMWMKPGDGYRALYLEICAQAAADVYRPGWCDAELAQAAERGMGIWLEGLKIAEQVSPDDRRRRTVDQVDGVTVSAQTAVFDWADGLDWMEEDFRVKQFHRDLWKRFEEQVAPARRREVSRVGTGWGGRAPKWEGYGVEDFGGESLLDPTPDVARWADPAKELEPLDLMWRDKDGREQRLRPTGWVACGAGLDFVWERHLRQRGYLFRDGKVAATVEPGTWGVSEDGVPTGEGIYGPSFDGRNVWVPVVGSNPGVIVLDSVSGKVTVFDAGDGLRWMDRRAVAVGLEPGRALVVGSSGSGGMGGGPRRTWAALLTLGPEGKKQVKMFYYAMGKPWVLAHGEVKARCAFDPNWGVKRADKTRHGEWEILIGIDNDDECRLIHTGALSCMPAMDTKEWAPERRGEDEQLRVGPLKVKSTFELVQLLSGQGRTLPGGGWPQSFVSHEGVLVGVNGFSGGIEVKGVMDDQAGMVPGQLPANAANRLVSTGGFGLVALVAERPGTEYNVFKVNLPALKGANGGEAKVTGVEGGKWLKLDVLVERDMSLVLTEKGISAVLGYLVPAAQKTPMGNATAGDNQLRRGVQTFMNEKRVELTPEPTMENYPGTAWSTPEPLGDMAAGTGVGPGWRIRVVSSGESWEGLSKEGAEPKTVGYMVRPTLVSRIDLPGATVVNFNIGNDALPPVWKKQAAWYRLAIEPMTPVGPAGPVEAGKADGFAKGVAMKPVAAARFEVEIPPGVTQPLWLCLRKSGRKSPHGLSGVWVDPDGMSHQLDAGLMVWKPGDKQINHRLDPSWLRVPGKYQYRVPRQPEGLGEDVEAMDPELVSVVVASQPGIGAGEAKPAAGAQPAMGGNMGPRGGGTGGMSGVVEVPYTGADGVTRKLRFLRGPGGPLKAYVAIDDAVKAAAYFKDHDDLGWRGSDGTTALFEAKSAAMAKALVNGGIPMDMKNYLGAMAIHAAAGKGRVEVVAFMIGEKVDANAKDSLGMTVMHHACGSLFAPQSILAVVKELKKGGADINAQELRGRTPLHMFCALEGLKDADVNAVLAGLVELGADLQAKDKQGKTAWDLAQTGEMKAGLEKVGGKKSEK